MALGSHSFGGGKGMNGTQNAKNAAGAVKAGWGRAGTGRGPKLRSKK